MTPSLLAIVDGKAITEKPAALYIPAAALRVTLNKYEGPLDLLSFLIRKNKFDILDIPMNALCRQYADYVESIIGQDLELTADYLNMLALLIEIKTKMLLPRPPSAEEEEEDPRADLVRRLLEYERMRQAAQELGSLPRRERDFVSPQVRTELPFAAVKPPLQSQQLAAVFAAILARSRNPLATMNIMRETISIRAIMSHILRRLRSGLRMTFQAICQPAQGGVTFIALLQMALEQLVHLQQDSDDEDEHLYIQLRQDQS